MRPYLLILAMVSVLFGKTDTLRQTNHQNYINFESQLEKKIPTVLSEQEVKRIIDVTINPNTAPFS